MAMSNFNRPSSSDRQAFNRGTKSKNKSKIDASTETIPDYWFPNRDGTPTDHALLERLLEARPDNQLVEMGKHFANCSSFKGHVYDALLMETTPVRMPGGALAFLELRWRAPGDAKGTKRFTIAFRAYNCDKKFMNDAGERLPVVLDTWGHLYDQDSQCESPGLLLPVGADELKKACDGARPGSVALYLCEGVHSMKGVKRRLEDTAVAHIVEKWKRAKGIDHIVVGAWVGGKTGAEHTNFGMIAHHKKQIVGQNDWKLDFSENGPIGRVVIVPDTDKPGYKEKEAVTSRLHEDFKCSHTKIFEVAPPPNLSNKERDKGWDDDNELPIDVTREDRVEQLLNPKEWQPEPYILNEHKKFVLNATNVSIHIMRNNEISSLLYYDEFLDEVMIKGPLPSQEPKGPYPRRFSDGDCRALLARIQHALYFEKTTKELVYDGVFMFAENHGSAHPIRERYDALTWDGTPRIEESFVTYWGANPSKYVSMVGRYWWIQLVARIYHPGCQADYMLTLIDEQGELKSTSLKRICGEEYFTDSIKDIVDHRKAGRLMRGKQIVEFAEMVALRKAGRDIAKAFITQTFDEYQPPYGHTNVKQPRQGVLVATTNDPQCLRDPTGDRRSWTITCGKVHSIDIEALERDIDQLLAETVHCYKNNERHWPTREEEKLYFKPQQDEHTVEYVWQVLLQEALEKYQNVDGVCVNMGQIAQFLRDRSDKENPQPNVIGPYLRKLGWTNDPVNIDGKKTRFWWREDQRALWLHDNADIGNDAYKDWERVKTRYLRWSGGAGGGWILGDPGVDEAMVRDPLGYDDLRPRPDFAGPKPAEPTKH
jgi:predicted P-loop ATPase